MHVMFEIYLAPGATGEGMFTQETLDDTMAQMMSPEDAKAVGFDGLPSPPEGVRSVFVVVAKRDERRIHNALEASPQAAQFRVHPVDIDL
ncbi:MAG: hypothetical protein AAF928_22175 [Myxococcota bacterium]